MKTTLSLLLLCATYGQLQMEPISEEHARHLVEDDGAAPPAARELRIVATAIEILD